jgi:50S ribosomal protein L16 3-hydroxylase
MNTPLALLGNISPAQFLTEYWQKKPLLIKQAIPNFKGLLDANELAGLACEDEVQSRIVQFKKLQWSVKNGPFDESDFAKLGKNNWTLLVQSVNHYLPKAADLLAQFNFIPHARLDDLMVSYAPIGGGVGAHVDSYDVFLLQGSGKRNWKISNQSDLSLVEGAPLRILKNFKADIEWVLEAGDMLYLPPQIAHWGVSESDDCMTYSIGFRAPKMQELQHEFLNYLQDHLTEEGLYSDPDLSDQQHPAEIGDAMVSKVSEMLQKMYWDKTHVADFLGQYLTEPKIDVVFVPNKKISSSEFVKRLAQKPLLLNLKSQLLFVQQHFYLNGEKLMVSAELLDCMQTLANQRSCATPALQPDIHKNLGGLLFEAYLAGFVCFQHD